MNSVYIVTSQAEDSHECTIHRFSTDRKQAVLLMEALANDELRRLKEVPDGEPFESPLRDTVPADEIISGITARYRKGPQDIIDLISIQRVDVGIVFSKKVRQQRVVKCFKVVRVDEMIPFPAPLLANTSPVTLSEEDQYRPTFVPAEFGISSPKNLKHK